MNLLPVFQALMVERSVTRAASRVGLSQPALSQALKRLRAQLGDELFTRTGRAMVPTPRALDIAARLRPALDQLESALEPGPADTDGEVNGWVALGLDDYLQAFLLPRLAVRLERRMPGITLDVRASGARRRSLPLLRDGKLDLSVDTTEVDERRDFEAATLFEDRYVCLVRRRLVGPVGQLSSELFSVLNHVAASNADPERQPVERELLKADLSRRISVRLPGLLAAPWLVAVSDSVALLPARLAAWFSETLPVDVLEPPVPLPPAQVVLRWHRRMEQNRAAMHVRDELIQIGREIAAT